MLAIIALLLGSPAVIHAQCDATRSNCAQAAANAADPLQFWNVVEAAMRSTTLSRAAWLAKHEVVRGDTKRAVLALTPDCGVYPWQLNDVLDMAKEQRVPLTVFILGSMIPKYPQESRAVIRRLAAEGHEIGLHGYTHLSFRDMTQAEVEDELIRTWSLIDWSLGYHYPVRFVRPPYGARNKDVWEWLGGMGLQSVFWSMDSMGWRDFATPLIVQAQVGGKAQNGDVVVMHCSAVSDRAAFPQVVRDLRAKGLQPDLLSRIAEPLPPDSAELRFSRVPLVLVR